MYVIFFDLKKPIPCENLRVFLIFMATLLYQRVESLQLLLALTFLYLLKELTQLFLQLKSSLIAFHLSRIIFDSNSVLSHLKPVFVHSEIFAHFLFKKFG